MPTMNGFNRSYMYRSTETEKKGRKLRNHREFACRCFPSFVKFHYYDCPAVMKPCPIHGNFFYHTEKHQKEDREQNVVISFHPSTKTERLLQPIKTLLSHCNSETKINFQYYSPENGNGKESVKPQNGQNAYESLKKSLNNNIFLEKTKSFVANKTNKVKKLKQCFHSPCNSIAQKTRSQTSIKEKLNQILREDAKQTRDVFYNLVPDIPPDDKEWLSSKRHDFLSDGKSDSDFITVTQQDKTNTIHHKIFEIKHRKGLNDIPFVGFPRQQTHLVYSTVNMTGGGAVKEKRENPCECNNEKRLSLDKTLPEGQEGDGETGKNFDLCPSEKTNGSIVSGSSSSSGSVYITPFIFVPKGMEDSDNELKSTVKQANAVETGVQVEELQTPKQVTSQKATLTSLTSKKSSQVSGRFQETKCHSVLLQTDSFLYEERICSSSRHLCEPHSTSRVEEIYVGSHERAVMTRNYDDESSRHSKRSEMSRRTTDSAQQKKATEMQTCSCNTCMEKPESARGTKTTEMQTGSGNIHMRTPDSAQQKKATEMQTCSCNTCMGKAESARGTKTTEMQTGSGSSRTRTPDSGRATKTTEIQTCSGTICVRTPDSGRYTKTTEMQTGSCTPYTRTPDSGRRTRTTEMQPGSLTPRTEVLIQARWGTRDKTSQTEDLWNVQVSVKTFDSGINKSEGSEAYTTTHLRHSNKEIQTSFYQCSPAETEFIQLSSPEVTYVIKPFEQQESDQAMDKLVKTWWGKSHSDSGLCERLKCACCKLDNENLYLQSDFSKNFETNNTPEKSTSTKVDESGAVDTRMENCPTLGNITVRTKETVERCCHSKETCTREEELSAAVSDLSELKKIIQEFFEKGNLSSKKACECGGTARKEAMVDAGTMTDSSILPPKQDDKKTFVDRAVQTNSQGDGENSEGKRERKTTGVQISVEKTEKKEVQTQTIPEEPKKAETKDFAAQTSVTALLEEAEQQKADKHNTKRQTFVTDKPNESKTFFVCAVCGRDVKNSEGATTSTSPFPKRPNMVAGESEYTKSFEVKMISKKVQNSESSKVSKANSPMERADDRNDKAARKPVRPQEDSSRPESSHKTRIPVPSHSAFVHFKNNETIIQRATDFPPPIVSHYRSTTPRGSQKPSTEFERECICDEVAGPSTSKDRALSNESASSKGIKPDLSRKEYPEVDNRKSGPAKKQKSKRNNREYYPVLVTHFWPEEIVKPWKSIEGGVSDIPSSDDAKFQTTKQKRSYSKDLETAPAEKKMMVDASHLSEEFLPELSDLFRQICSSNFESYPLKTQQDERNSAGTDEEAVKKLAQSLREIDEEFLQDSLHLSDSSNTDNSFSGDEEDDKETVRAAEHSARHKFHAASTQAAKIKPQSHSAVSFNAPPSPEDATTSKSLNTFLIIINPKKHKMFRRKHTK